MKNEIHSYITNVLKLFLLITVFTFSSVFAIEDTTWQSDWTYSTNATAKTITLTKYNGTEETMEVPSKVIISGEEYSVIFGSGAGKTSAIKNLSFEEGVKITATSSLFSGNTTIEKVDLKGADTSAATTFYYMFKGCTNLKEVNMTDIDTSKVTSLSYTFSGATNLQKVVMSGLDLSSVTNVRYLFYQSSNIEEIDFSNTNMSKITTFAYTSPNNSYASAPFMDMKKLKKVNMKNFNTEALTTAERMFMVQVGSADNQNHIQEIDVTNWNISNVTSLYETFAYCGVNEDTVIKGLDTLDTSNVKNFSGTFLSAAKVKDLTGVEDWDTSAATNMHSMFSGCKAITKLDLSSWNTSNVTNMGSMFVSCESLKDLNVSTFNTSKVKVMDTIFKGCASLEVLNLKNWTSESVENKAGSHMFEMLGAKSPGWEYPLTPLKEITLNDNFKFALFQPPSLRSGYWHLKEGTEDETKPKFTSARLYTSYNNGVTPPSGYSHDHTYVLTEIDPADAEYYAQGWGDNNAWEVHYPADKFKAYCINLHRGSPNGYYDRTKVSGNSIVDLGFLDSDDYGWEPLGSNMEEALITLIYYGYSNDADGIQEKYGLTNDEFLLVTQNAIWNFTDRYSKKKEYDPNTKTGKAYNELLSKRFNNIPNKEDLKLYLYESLDGKQNLLSISGLSNVAHAGVRVLKLAPAADGSLEPLIGAEFTIYDDNNKEVGTIISDENGYATKYNTDSIYGLPEGIYTIKETKAPRGYTKTNNYYKFIVRKEDDNEIITVGKLNSSGDDTAMIFENTNNTSVQGGGLIIKIVDKEDNPIPTGATFEILDENGNVISTITTDNNGSFMTGKKDLPLNKTYTARLKNGPAGYISTVEIKSDTLTENEKYKTLIFKFIKKTCKVEISALKKYNKALNKGDFTFELYNINDKTTVTSTNDKKGNISFNLTFDANNLGYMIYQLKEVNDKKQNITYDAHTEEVIVSVEDTGEENLTCKVMTEKPTFENKYTDPGCPDCNTDDKKEDSEKPNTNVKTNHLVFILPSILIVLIFVDYVLIKKKYKKVRIG